jgi:transcriptional regulator with XRE-family HTH domain
MVEPLSKRNIVGPNVQRIRESKNLTQERLAAELQMLGWDADRFIVSKIERGQREVTDKEIVLLAKVLGASAGELFENK